MKMLDHTVWVRGLLFLAFSAAAVETLKTPLAPFVAAAKGPETEKAENASAQAPHGNLPLQRRPA